MRRIQRLQLVALAGAAIVAGLSCGDEAMITPEKPQGSNTAVSLNTVPSGSVQALIQREPLTSDGLETFVIRIYAKDVNVGAYQGSVHFAPDAFQVIQVYAPQNSGGDAYVLNTNDIANGVIRFAACTPLTFHGADTEEGIEAFRFTVRPLRPTAQSGLRTALEMVGDANGSPLDASHVLNAPEIYGAAGQPIR